MRGLDTRSRDITRIIEDVVRGIECDIKIPDIEGYTDTIPCPPINYVFGNAKYVYQRLNELSNTGSWVKYPLIALFVPVTEQRGNPENFARMKVQVLIAFSSLDTWSNEERRVISFENVLRPIYRAFMQRLRRDGRFETAYQKEFPHKYSENYSYGRFGAYTPSGEKLPDPIDAINITELELTIKKQSCISL